MRRLSLWDFTDSEILPGVITATIFGSQCSTLRHLDMEAAAVGLAGRELAAVAVLTQLSFLKVRRRIGTMFRRLTGHHVPDSVSVREGKS